MDEEAAMQPAVEESAGGGGGSEDASASSASETLQHQQQPQTHAQPPADDIEIGHESSSGGNDEKGDGDNAGVVNPHPADPVPGAGAGAGLGPNPVAVSAPTPSGAGVTPTTVPAAATATTNTTSAAHSAAAHSHFAAPPHPHPLAAHAPAAVAPLPFLAPSDLLRPHHPSRTSSTTSASARPHSPPAPRPMTPLDKEQIDGLRAIRAFLKVRTSYDVLPLSYRLIVFDTSLLVKKSLNILTQCAIVSAPLWDSKTSTFAGLLTTSDYINVVQYYWQNPDALQQVDKFRLNSLREIERAIGVSPIETVSIHPLEPLYDACRRMLASRARRIPLIDIDDETQREMVVSVITQYRILKFISVNVKETQNLRKPLKDIKIGTYHDLATATMNTPVMDCIHMLVKKSISSVPILDKDGSVLNVFEAVDVITLIKGGDYETNLNLTVGKAIEKRSDDFPGIYTCTLNDRLDTIFDTVRKSRVHRLVIVDENGQLKGLLSLSDILEYTLNSPLGDEHEQ